MSIRILVNLFYKPVDQLIDKLKDPIYFPINGGSSLNGESFPIIIQPDNTGDNISSKNPKLNEMTSLYWAWKHFNELGNPDYVGFNHYRRFFRFDDIKDYERYDIIIANPIKCNRSLAWQYRYYHNVDDLQTAVNTLREIDVELGNGFCRYLNEKTDNFAPCNMFVMKKTLFFEWCELIFKFLYKLEPRINLDDGRDNYQKRALCFITERLFGYWCYMKKSRLSVKEVEIEEHLDFKNNSLNERGTY